MASPDDPKGVSTPSGETVHNSPYDENLSYGEGWSTSGVSATEHEQTVTSSAVETSVISAPPAAPGGSGKPPKPPEPPEEEGDEDEGMARMSFLEHLEELRKRLLLAVGGVGAAFFLCLFFSDELWGFVVRPATAALTHLGIKPPTLAQISPMDSFRIMWME